MQPLSDGDMFFVVSVAIMYGVFISMAWFLGGKRR